ncbi:H-NS family nucleoid-associated regulatory protein [Plastorhodobacter daqingensis]|uniref:H-NS family nucleoid-associated regulatory protein n=1 Tax=Plastorhodobacter daqingensis TaxID=1387281 RepID=A0ABW2UR41_9RHOB
MAMNLNDLSLKELKQLQKDVTQAIETYKDRQREEALREIENIAREKGFSLSELTGALKKRRKTVAPKYVHPEEPDLTWTGRGRQPRWVGEALAAGKTMDDLRISA